MPASQTPAVDLDGDGYTSAEGDCDDADAASHPAGVEHCDGQDNDCDGTADEGDLTGFHDTDHDGFGSDDPIACSPPIIDMVTQRGDCDDANPLYYPGAADAAYDGEDQDCGGTEGPDPHAGLGIYSRASIQAALDEAVPGNVVWVGAGKYLEHDVNFLGRDVALKSTALASATLIDANGTGPGVVFTGGEGAAAVLDGFTIIGGYGEQDGGGIRIIGSSPTIVGCVIQRSGPRFGVYLESSESSIIDTRISENPGRGLGAGQSNITLLRCLISANHGGGIESSESRVVVQRSVIRENVTNYDGAGIYALDSDISLSHCAITENLITGDLEYGAGLYLSDSTLLVDQSVIAYNDGALMGAGVYVLRGNAVLIRTLIAHNDGGGKYASHTAGVAGPESEIFINRCVLFLNEGTYTSAVSVSGIGQLRIEQSMVVGNRAYDGNPPVGGIAANGSGLEIHNTVLSDNICLYRPGYNLWTSGDVAQEQLLWNDFYNPPDQFNTNVGGLDPSNLSVEPMFLAYNQGALPTDPHLALGSPLIDAGDPAQLDPDGTRADIGIFGGEDGDTWDLDCDGLPTWFWPGSYADVPAGVDASKYDADTVPLSSDWSTWPCLTAAE